MIVTVTAYRRPVYLQQVMASIRLAAEYVSPEPVFVVARVEPSEVQGLVLDLIGRGRGTYVTLNEEQQGHVANIRLAFDDAWALADRLDEDFVMHLPDDILVAPDAFECAAYVRDTLRDDKRCVGMTLFSREEPEVERWRQVSWMKGWCSQGFATWRDRWPLFEGVWEPHVEKKQRGGDPEGYRGIDRCIHEDLLGPGTSYFQVHPVLSRCKHIGLEDGVHTTPETFVGDSPTLYAADVEPEGEWTCRLP